tara:strand:- start:70 stop:345 length:276 start_codon:yes stop_codon:yes gene_type:complete
MSTSCSFRITRTAEDLAQTINSLSQRLIKLEQRFEAIELQFEKLDKGSTAEEIQMLDGIDQTLKECQELLDGPSPDETWFPEDQEEESLAA